MSATELIEQLKALPAGEQKAFARLLSEWEKQRAAKAGNGNGSAARPWPEFGPRLKRIYGNRVAADSEPVVSYARGD